MRTYVSRRKLSPQAIGSSTSMLLSEADTMAVRRYVHERGYHESLRVFGIGATTLENLRDRGRVQRAIAERVLTLVRAGHAPAPARLDELEVNQVTAGE